jgi:hypothetical protein
MPEEPRRPPPLPRDARPTVPRAEAITEDAPRALFEDIIGPAAKVGSMPSIDRAPPLPSHGQPEPPPSPYAAPYPAAPPPPPSSQQQPFWPSAGTPVSSPARPPSSDRALESSLRNQIMTGISGQHAAAVPLDPRSTAASGPYSAAQREAEGPRSSSTVTKEEDGLPLGYVVASAFFLTIALVGFALWLAFEVISL